MQKGQNLIQSTKQLVRESSNRSTTPQKNLVVKKGVQYDNYQMAGSAGGAGIASGPGVPKQGLSHQMLPKQTGVPNTNF